MTTIDPLNPNDLHPDDATLVAWLDEELSATDAAGVAQVVESDAALRRRVDLLRAAREELSQALLAPAARATPRRQLGLWLVAAAALAVVCLLLLAKLDPEPSVAAQNEWLALRVLPVRGGWPLFSGIQFDLEGRARTQTPCRIIGRQADETDAQLADRAFANRDNHAVLPLVLEAHVTEPDGTVRAGTVVRVEGTFGVAATRLRVELVDVVLPHPGINPLVGASLLQDSWGEDFLWAFRRVGGPDLQGRHGYVPEVVGDYRIRFSLRSFTAPGGRFLTFAEPLTAEAAFSVSGAVGTWSEPVDGMCARIAASVAVVRHGGPLALAVQLQNNSDRPRSYNVTGVTNAPIPQPFHFDLLIDGEQWTQRELAVIHPGAALGLAQPVGSMRSVIVLSDYWHDGNQSPNQEALRPSHLVGKHRVAFRFHSRMLLWNAADTQLWQGKIDTPAIEIDFGARR